VLDFQAVDSDEKGLNGGSHSYTNLAVKSNEWTQTFW